MEGMTVCSSAAHAVTTSFTNLLSSSSASRRPPNFLVTASQTQTRLFSFIGCGAGNFSPLVSVPRNLLCSLPSSFTHSSQIEDPSHLSDEELLCTDNLGTVGIKIQLRKECKFGEQFFIVGAQPDLGLWNPLDAVPMTWSDDHLWTAELDIPLGEPVLFKFLLREITGKFLWQPGKDRVLHTWETCNIISVIEDWEDVEAQQVSEEPAVNNECKGSNLMKTKVKQLKHSNEKYNDEETYESSEFASSAVCSNHEIVATAATNISDDSITDMASNVEICDNPVVDENVTSHASKDEEAISEENVIVEEEQVKVEDDTKSEAIEKQVNEYKELEKVNGRSLTFNAEHSDLKLDNEDAYRQPDQYLESVFPERQNNKEGDFWRNEMRWGQITLKRFLNNFGFL